MAVITATSDFGPKDATLAKAKAHFIRRVKELHWVDISHEVEPHNIQQASFLLKRAFTSFPPGTVHVVFVGSGPQQGLTYVCVKANKQYFIAANNGVLPSLLADAKITDARALDIRGVDPNDVFALYSTAAAHLTEGGKLELLGPVVQRIKRIKEHEPMVEEQMIRGSVVYIDHYGTCITNITKSMFDAQLRGRKPSVETPRNRSIGRFYDRIGDVPPGKLAAVWDEHQHLCIVVGKSGGEHVKGSNELLGMKVHDWVRMDFI